MNLSAVMKESSMKKLLELLKSIEGKKDLILDNELICSLDFIANFSQLKKVGIEKVFRLEPGASPGVEKKCLYLIRPSVKMIKVIADHINATRCSENQKSFWVIYVPRKLFICNLLLEREGIFGYVNQMEFPLGFLPLDKDIFSLGIADFYKSFYLREDLTDLHTAAISIVQLLKISGSVPNIHGQGRCARMVIDSMNMIMGQTKFEISSTENISDLIIVDREIDYTSVLLSQLTYEGLLDETFGINSGRIVFPKQVTGKDEPIKVLLNSDNIVYEEIRNCHFASVFYHLRKRAKELQAQTETSNMSINDMKDFVSKEVRNIRQQQASLSLHIGACEYIMEEKNLNNFQEQLRVEHDILEGHYLKENLHFIADIVNKQESIFRALRLLCLVSITQDGLHSTDYKSMISQLLQSYGHKHLVTIQNLRTTGLLYKQAPVLNVQANSSAVKATSLAEKVAAAVVFPRKSTFKAASKKLNLICCEEVTVDLQNPSHMSYVFGGYTPLISKITEEIVLDRGFKNIQDGLKVLHGETISIPSSNQVQKQDNKTKSVAVFFLGGVTYAEIASVRLLSKLHGRPILILCTSVLSGNSLIKMLMPDDT